MTPAAERRLLQLAVAIACLVPLTIGAASVALGPSAIARGLAVSASFDSHFRYLSGIFLALGLGFASCVPAIEARGPRFRLLGAMVVAGGLARLLSLGIVGWPGAGHRFGLVMELGVVPLLMLWQARVARRSSRQEYG
ncbi:hypothetical protein ACFB49_43310 [Sphingomonas sp. DBB INV C78]|uniref:DUF4345 domain-containing protein n=1 Tax=Sphingomonas sp. DBB INV C78 TaxID=3349434 RepID=UPI0036D2AA6B